MLTLKNPDWAVPRQLDDFLPDHGHLMHLYVIRRAGCGSRVASASGDDGFAVFSRMRCLPMPAGQYKLYGDVVHRDVDSPETMVAGVDAAQHDLRGNSDRRRRCGRRSWRVAGWSAHRVGS